jgi:hypothetical protein
MSFRHSMVGLDLAEENLERLKSAFLRERGWGHTCDTPGCHWLWQFTLPDGRIILTTTDSAVAMEKAGNWKLRP